MEVVAEEEEDGVVEGRVGEGRGGGLQEPTVRNSYVGRGEEGEEEGGTGVGYEGFAGFSRR